MLDEVEISPVLHKVTGDWWSQFVRGGPGDVGSWGEGVVSEFSGACPSVCWSSPGDAVQQTEEAV